jgi:hypothetical protein
VQYSRNPSPAYTDRPAGDDPSTPYSATGPASWSAAYVIAAPIPRRRASGTVITKYTPATPAPRKTVVVATGVPSSRPR